MVRSVLEMEQEVRALQTVERNQLLCELIADLDGQSECNAKEAWLHEVQWRYKELQNRQVESVPAAEAIRKAKSRLKYDD
jgi:hypothetical protein